MDAPEKQSINNSRLQSLDALRGFDMFWIIGWGGIWHTLAKLTDSPFFNWWSVQMKHVDWHGFAFYDLIFPLFLFIAGISFPFSMAKNQQNSVSTKQLYLRIFKRAFLLVFLGMIFNGLLKFDFSTMRYASVLGRIGLAWMFAALIFINTGRTGRIVWCVSLLVFYWLLLALVPAPDYPGAELFSKEGNFTSYIDRIFLPGRLYDPLYDPLGLLGTIPSISNALLGMFAGELVMSRKEGLTGMKKTVYLFVAGAVLLVIALLWDQLFPINKKLWTSSFVCLTAGIGSLLFGLFYLLIDVLEYRRWPFFFTVIGVNSITIYLAQAIINFGYTSKFLFGGLFGLFPEAWANFLNSIALVAVCWLFLYFLYKQKIFLKV
jgi:predicted acyltransferase